MIEYLEGKGGLSSWVGTFTEKWLCIDTDGKEMFMTRFEMGEQRFKGKNAHFPIMIEIGNNRCKICNQPLRLGYCVYCPLCDDMFCLDCIKIKNVYHESGTKIETFESGTNCGSNWYCHKKHLIRKFRSD